MLLPDVPLQPVCDFLKRVIRPFLGFVTRLIELLDCVRRRIRWREELGPQLSSVSCLCRPQEPVVFFVRFTRTLVPPFQLLLFLLILDTSFQELLQITFFRQCMHVRDQLRVRVADGESMQPMDQKPHFWRH